MDDTYHVFSACTDQGWIIAISESSNEVGLIAERLSPHFELVNAAIGTVEALTESEAIRSVVDGDWKYIQYN